LAFAKKLLPTHHEAAGYAIRATRSAHEKEGDQAALRECYWQRRQQSDAIRVVDDQRQRNDICWNVFAC
jgi:uncharacterized membrane-anchored protein